MHLLIYPTISHLFTQIYNLYLDTDKRPIDKKNNAKSIPPSCRRAGVQTAGELLAEETTLMDYQEGQTTSSATDRWDQRIPLIKQTPTTSDEEDGSVTSYQKPPKETLLSGTPEPDLSSNLPGHVYEDLYGYWRSHSYYQSRARIFEAFATDGPFPSVTSFNFMDDPQTGLTRKFVDELEVATRNFKKKICRIHAKNYEHLATTELKKINTLLQEAKSIYDATLVQDTVKRAREQVFTNTREIKRQKNKNKNRTSDQAKRRRSPSRGRSRKRKQRTKH